MWRLTDRIVRSTLVTAWRLATSPTSTSPFFANATIDGVVREPSAFAMTVGSPPSRTLTTELVVPRSMPTARAMSEVPLSMRLVWPLVDPSLGCPGCALRRSPGLAPALEPAPAGLMVRFVYGTRQAELSRPGSIFLRGQVDSQTRRFAFLRVPGTIAPAFQALHMRTECERAHNAAHRRDAMPGPASGV